MLQAAMQKVESLDEKVVSLTSEMSTLKGELAKKEEAQRQKKGLNLAGLLSAR
jgi:uncharacterized small protein (DUF1192 family)